MNSNTTATQKKTYYKRKFSFLNLVEWFATILLFLAIGLTIAGFFPISHPWLTKQIELQLKKNGADDCALVSSSLTFWHGIELHGLKVLKHVNNQETYILTAGKVKLSINLPSAIFNSADLIKSPLNLHSDLFSELYKNNDDKLKEVIQFLINYKGFKSLTLDNASFSVHHGQDSTPLSLENSTIVCTRDIEKKYLEVKYQFDTLSMGTTTLQNSSGILAVDGRYIKVQKARGTWLTGKYHTSGEIDTWSLQCHNGQLSFSDIELASLLDTATSSANGSIKGIVDGDVRFEDCRLNRDSLEGNGTLTFRNLDITRAGIQHAISQLLSVPDLETLHFDRVKNDFTLKKNFTLFNETEGTGKLLDFQSKGWIHPDGTIDQALKGDVAPELVKKLPPFISKSMEKGKDGRNQFNCRIFGQIAAPKVQLDSMMLQRAVGNVFDDVRENLQQFFMQK